MLCSPFNTLSRFTPPGQPEVLFYSLPALAAADIAAVARLPVSLRIVLEVDPRRIEPLVPVDLVVDHSVQVDYYGTPQALQQNMAREFERNFERYQFMKWGMQAFDTFRVVPPGVGIVHQVNLEHLFSGVRQQQTASGRLCYPDTLVGTDSHTTM